jgi:predicted transport protein
MKLFSLINDKVKTVSSKDFRLEKDIQNLIEKNLKEFFNLQLVKSEFSIKNFRIDTLCFDEENKSFVIVEYKRGSNYSVIDQGYTYMSILINNKSDFILEYNEIFGKALKRDEIDWEQSKVIFISPQFTDYQKQSINFRDVPFELWEIKWYENDLFGFVQHKNTSNESISSISKDTNDVVSVVSREVKVYTEDYHLNTKNLKDDIKEIYFNLKERILNIGEVNVIPRKLYICFSRKTNFVDVEIRNKDVKIYINLKIGELDDPKNITKDVSNQGHWGNGDYEIRLYPDTDLDYVMFLINQSYKKQD